ncbi:MAG TPA: MCE family protein [Actinophytocola sp.]|uniref:MCE family protein n=1 Tax=Actinophytocola sp. TaxID=1872138 RepID=UPI002DC0179B|nr:MCE family protein [Actinophytocola sp.]HEU5470296.1 MCE family protein [Actinophytocola sp.]
MMIRRLALTLVVTLATGCSAFGGVYDVPLPGGADVGEHPYRVTAHFRDVLDLVPQSGVKVADVAVGRVERIELAEDGRSAAVTMLINGSVRLPANAMARLRQSSLLGEKFVELDSPPNPVTARLADGADIPLERTNRNPEIEEVFGALSMLLNGGGVGQLQQITRELNKALEGNETEVRSLLTNVDTFTGGLAARRDDIVRVLDGLDRLSASFGGRSKDIAGLLDNLGGGIKVLADQREAFVRMLTALDTLSGVAVDTVNRSRDDLVADLHALEPTLRQLADSGQNLPQAMELLLTFPFPDAVLDGIKGDYLNVYLTVHTNTAAGPRPAALPMPLPTVDSSGGTGR